MKGSTIPRWSHTTKTRLLVLGAPNPRSVVQARHERFGILVLLMICYRKSGVTLLFVARQMAMIVISLSLKILYWSNFSYIKYYIFIVVPSLYDNTSLQRTNDYSW